MAAYLERVDQAVTKDAAKAPESKIYRLSQTVIAYRVSEGRRLYGKHVFKVS